MPLLLPAFVIVWHQGATKQHITAVQSYGRSTTNPSKVTADRLGQHEDAGQFQ